MEVQNKVIFVVINENVLGYIKPEEPNIVGILHASILRGYTGNILEGWFYRPLNDKGMRPAKRQDFIDFRVYSDTYRRDTARYNFPTD